MSPLGVQGPKDSDHLPYFSQAIGWEVQQTGHTLGSPPSSVLSGQGPCPLLAGMCWTPQSGMPDPRTAPYRDGAQCVWFALGSTPYG